LPKPRLPGDFPSKSSDTQPKTGCYIFEEAVEEEGGFEDKGAFDPDRAVLTRL